MEEELKTEIDYKTRRIVIFIYFFIIILCVLAICNYFGVATKIENKYIKSGLNAKSIVLNNEKINVVLEPSIIKKERWCQILKEDEDINENAWVQVVDNSCEIDITSDSKYIIIKDEKNISPKTLLSNYINAIISLNIKNPEEKIIFVLGEQKELATEIEYIGNPDTTLTYISENENIIKTDDNIIEGISVGTTNIIIKDYYNHEINIPVVVTDLITLPQLNENKEFLPAGRYTEEEAKLLDELLEDRVNKAGLKTRAGVVAAARFITLEFKYRIPYFLENGRFQKTGFSEQIDGEGRFYHKGLYLSKDKFEIIKRSKRKPATWGETLYEYSNSRYMKNGLDCSGFVTWALYNGGYDPGDIGAGPKEWYTTLPDLGVSQEITLNLLKSGKVKAGDLIGWNGHIGIIIGIDDEYIYTADTIYYQKGLVATKYTYQQMVNSYFTNIYDMSEYYVDDGNYTNMW